MPQLRNRKLSFVYDRHILLSVLGLLSLGLLMVASASMVISDRQYGYPFHFLFHQLAYLVVGLGLALLVTRIPLSFWESISGYLLILSLFLLVLVLIPGIGREVNGSRRWLGLGPVGLQVSELVKFCVIVYLSSYLVRRQEEVQTRIIGFLKPLALLAVICGLLLLEPDFGASAVMLAAALGLFFLGGVRFWHFVGLLALVILAMSLFAVIEPYRLMRLKTFLDPWANQFSGGYQLTQSLIAFGRGGIFGVGLGNSIQKLFYLPEAHTDFLFAVLAEELGLLGELVVVGLFAWLIGRVLWVGKMKYEKNPYSAYLAWGFGLWLGLQAMINIGVNSGVLPTKGLTLPLMSYGGSSLVIMCVVIGILLRISYEASML